MLLTVPSFAKLNWTLEVLGKRADGYHELRTLLQTISAADELVFELLDQHIELHSAHPELPLDESNLIYRAARSLREFTGCNKGVRVTINKRLPLAAGLGGGSSNAAVTLMALLKLWQVRLETQDLFRLGAQLGADVPFFFLGGTCIGVGRGDEVYPTAEIVVEHILLVNVNIAVPTREVYGSLPPGLTNPGTVTKMPISLRTAFEATCSRQTGASKYLPVLHNDLETPVFKRHLVLADIKQHLLKANARGSLMSGSGSTVFAFFDSAAALSAAQQDLQQRGWWCAQARTLSRTEYHQALQLS